GQLLAVSCAPFKDPSAMHVDDPAAFPERWQAVVAASTPVEVPRGTVPATSAATPLPVDPPWPAPLAEEALYGLAGDVVRTLEPGSEADPVALLVQLLAGAGSIIGRGPHFVVEADQHFGNEFFVLVGRTAKGRKGTSWGRVLQLLRAADSVWSDL